MEIARGSKSSFKERVGIVHLIPHYMNVEGARRGGSQRSESKGGVVILEQEALAYLVGP